MPISLSQVLSVVLALAVVYYVLSLIVSMLTKGILEAFDTRGRSLEDFLKKQLVGVVEEGKDFTLEKLKGMPQINSLKPVRYAKKYGFPVGFITGKTEIIDYVEQIPPKNLVDALFDFKGTAKKGKEKILEVVNLLPDKVVNLNGDEVALSFKKDLKKMVIDGFGDVEAFRSKMETWCTGLMDQASQKFKAQARRWVILISLLVSFLFGVDTIELARLYWQDATIAATADAYATLLLNTDDTQVQTQDNVQTLAKELEDMRAINFSWYIKPEKAADNWLVLKLLGILITAIAVAQGSSFWYDLIKQIKGEQTKKKEESESESTTTVMPDGTTIERRLTRG